MIRFSTIRHSITPNALGFFFSIGRRQILRAHRVFMSADIKDSAIEHAIKKHWPKYEEKDLSVYSIWETLKSLSEMLRGNFSSVEQLLATSKRQHAMPRDTHAIQSLVKFQDCVSADEDINIKLRLNPERLLEFAKRKSTPPTSKLDFVKAVFDIEKIR